MERNCQLKENKMCWIFGKFLRPQSKQCLAGGGCLKYIYKKSYRNNNKIIIKANNKNKIIKKLADSGQLGIVAVAVGSFWEYQYLPRVD